MWNSFEWSSISQATQRTQSPILRRALKEVKAGTDDEVDLLLPKRTITSLLISLKNIEKSGVNSYAGFPGKQNLGEMLLSAIESLAILAEDLDGEALTKICEIGSSINTVLNRRKPNSGGNYPAFDLKDISEIKEKIQDARTVFGELHPYEGPDEDTPSFFNNENFVSHLERLADENNVQQYLDIFIMRIRSILTDARICSVIETPSATVVLLLFCLHYFVGYHIIHYIIFFDYR